MRRCDDTDAEPLIATTNVAGIVSGTSPIVVAVEMIRAATASGNSIADEAFSSISNAPRYSTKSTTVQL